MYTQAASDWMQTLWVFLSLNLSNPVAFLPAINTLSGTRIELILDPAILLVRVPDEPEWLCVWSASNRRLKCDSTLILAPAPILPPRELSIRIQTCCMIRTTSELLLTTLQGDSDLSDNARTIELKAP